jgi:tRNA(Ile)-lysidine synthase
MTGGRPPSSLAAPLNGHDIDALFAGWTAYRRIALAVSGGADSVGLMLLAHDWLSRTTSPPHFTVLTVDHGLRTEATQEAAWVKGEAARLGFPHETLSWTGAKPRADLQAAARAARYGLMLDFCRQAGIEALATAHNADDQAETLLMRLARGSGVDGLAAISPVSIREGIALLRPLLAVPRSHLEATLVARRQIWIEDPSNCDRRFERVRLREELRGAALFQLTPEKLALSAHRLDRARSALEAMTCEFLRGALTIHPAGYGEIPLAALREAQEEIAIRAIPRLAGMFGSGQRPVRLIRVEGLYGTLMEENPRGATLGGCAFLIRRGVLRVVREYGRIDPARVPLPEGGLFWDGRFQVAAPGAEGVAVGPLGPRGIAALRAIRGSIAFPQPVAHSLPALWHGETLIFAPFAAFAEAPPPFWASAASATFTKADGTLRYTGETANGSLTD